VFQFLRGQTCDTYTETLTRRLTDIQMDTAKSNTLPAWLPQRENISFTIKIHIKMHCDSLSTRKGSIMITRTVISCLHIKHLTIV